MVKCLLGQPVIGPRRVILVPFCETTIEGSYDESWRDEKDNMRIFSSIEKTLRWECCRGRIGDEESRVCLNSLNISLSALVEVGLN